MYILTFVVKFCRDLTSFYILAALLSLSQRYAFKIGLNRPPYGRDFKTT